MLNSFLKPLKQEYNVVFKINVKWFFLKISFYDVEDYLDKKYVWFEKNVCNDVC